MSLNHKQYLAIADRSIRMINGIFFRYRTAAKHIYHILLVTIRYWYHIDVVQVHPGLISGVRGAGNHGRNTKETKCTPIRIG